MQRHAGQLFPLAAQGRRQRFAAAEDLFSGNLRAVSGVSEATNAASIDGTKWVVVTP
jgi:hypothetical protein